MSEGAKALREHYAAHGICISCGAEKAEHGKYCLLCWDKIQQRNAAYKLTDKQRKRKNERASERYKELKAAGICVNCAKRQTDGKHVTCDICRLAKLARDRDKAHANGVVPQDMRGQGFCTRCYKPTDGKVCAECYAVLVKQAAYMRSKQDNAEHVWRKNTRIACDIVKRRQTNGEPPRIDFNVQGGKVTQKENKQRTEEI